MDKKLKPCPFCGDEVRLEMVDSASSNGVKIYHSVHCPKCWFWMFKELSKEKTLERWNRRATP